MLTELQGENIDDMISTFLDDGVCKNEFISAVGTIRNAYNAMTNLIKYSSFGNIKSLKQAIVTACSQNIATCERSTTVLLDMLSGRNGEGCDLVNNLYERDLSF